MCAETTYPETTGGEITETGSTKRYTYSAYDKIITNYVYALEDRDELVKECHLALHKIGTYAEKVPDVVYNDLYAYIVKYVYR
ncbi:hypothetical protein D3C76_1220620 [compost metagenome]